MLLYCLKQKQKNLQHDTCLYNPLYNMAEMFYLFNHVDLTITYHNNPLENGSHITSIKVVPMSIDHGNTENSYPNCNSKKPMIIPNGISYGKEIDVAYTYSVKFIENNKTKWSSRWDYILNPMPNNGSINIQWFGIFCSLAIVAMLTGLLSYIMLCKLRKDIDKFERNGVEKFGWILVHGDVFRSPQKSILLATLLGNGVQLLVVTFITLAFACVGLLSPANRGALMTCAIYLYILFGALAGYVAGRFNKTFGGTDWRIIATLSSMLCPGYLLF